MSILSMLDWVESTDLSTAIREGALYYPALGGIHLLGIAVFGGMIIATDLRLLGWAMRRRLVADVVEQSRPWKQVGFALVVISGLLLTWAEPQKLYRSPSFWIKLASFALVGVHAWVFQAGVYRDPERLDVVITSRAKWAAALSLFLWAALIVSGRLIAFDA